MSEVVRLVVEVVPRVTYVAWFQRVRFAQPWNIKFEQAIATRETKDTEWTAIQAVGLIHLRSESEVHPHQMNLQRPIFHRDTNGLSGVAFFKSVSSWISSRVCNADLCLLFEASGSCSRFHCSVLLVVDPMCVSPRVGTASRSRTKRLGHADFHTLNWLDDFSSVQQDDFAVDECQ